MKTLSAKSLNRSFLMTTSMKKIVEEILRNLCNSPNGKSLNNLLIPKLRQMPNSERNERRSVSQSKSSMTRLRTTYQVRESTIKKRLAKMQEKPEHYPR